MVAELFFKTTKKYLAVLQNLSTLAPVTAQHMKTDTHTAAPLAVRRALAKYGETVCAEAYALSKEEGDSTVSHSIPALKGNRSMANAAINAGRWIAKA